MEVLPYIFTVMKWFGAWRPIEWCSEWKTYFYSMYTLLIILIILLSLLSEMIYLIKFVRDVDEIASSSFLFLTKACVFYKLINILSRRSDIIRFIDSLKNFHAKSNDPGEEKIQNESDKRFKQQAQVYSGLVTICVIAMSVANYFNNVPQRTLSYNAWFPFNHSKDIGYWIAYFYQVIAQGVCSTLCVAYDSLFCGFMKQSCAQLKILQYRLQSMPQSVINSIKNNKKLNNELNVEEVEKTILQRCVLHHHDIFKYSQLTNEIFGIAIFVQSTVSTFVVCCSLYMLSRMKPLSSEFTSMSTYMLCMLVQIFLYCWFGNEVMLESLDVRNSVYAMEWTKLQVGTQKCLVIIMARTLEPIKFTSASIIVLSLETYKSLIKLSYSIFNLIQQTSE